ncbi:alkaline phosphatase D family protein [Gynuella sunshinyii]|uniref:Phosphodiesterase/alkaline phosphatase D n=1 Tax=Gynuella sunshinyii YC6258 TaxID=1445510 RepID=A0A0C5W007_9GAMM|nr:alkaline phosphatase D family protein [Gynuella sunshinyii]AJQ96014.1 phosphodiesterase/alkaline phosphatase D [Gynuella sunshinyii YC6258]
MSYSRRKFIQQSSRGVAGIGLLGTSALGVSLGAGSGHTEIEPGAFNFGVASGDPRQDRVIIWSHFQPAGQHSTPVQWQVALDEGMMDVVAEGIFVTTEARGNTIKVDVSGLLPGTTYFYQFRVEQAFSEVGRTRTAPEGDIDLARFAVISCSSYAHGYFNVYRILSERDDLDGVLHLGDYIYEYGQDEYDERSLRNERTLTPTHELISLTDYRRRYALYRLDADLQAVHRQHPFITVWDDHEFANDAFQDGAENHNEGEGEWRDRKAAARQAYFEWMPIRENRAGGISRTLRYGDLLELIMLDTRIEGRVAQPGGVDRQSEAQDFNRTLMGFEQEAWLQQQLSGTTARWKVIGQQVMMAQRYYIKLPDLFGGGASLWLDSWDGYAATRDRLLGHIRDHGIDNVVVLTGDVHSSFAADLSDNPYDANNYDRNSGIGSLAVEFVTPSITSPGFPPVLAETGAATIMAASPHIKYAELRQHGFILLTLNRDEARADWFYVADVLKRSTQYRLACSFLTRDKENRLVSV